MLARQANNLRQLGLFQGQNLVLLRRAVVKHGHGAQRVELGRDLPVARNRPVVDQAL
jgi:hypothetical protein